MKYCNSVRVYRDLLLPMGLMSLCEHFVYISMSLKITFYWFKLLPSRIRYEYSQIWNDVLYKDTKRAEGKNQSQRKQKKNSIFKGKILLSENVQIKILLYVLLLFGALGLLDEGLINSFL